MYELGDMERRMGGAYEAYLRSFGADGEGVDGGEGREEEVGCRLKCRLS